MIALRFLSLEDNPLDAEVIQTTLTNGGIDCELLRVETRSSFVAALETYEFDLILADYTLPSFDGISALEIACNLCPDVPFIFVTASLGEELAIETLKSGATDYVLKQRLGRLVPCVQRALREAQERRARKQAEEALRQSEARLKQLVELNLLGVMFWDVDGRVLDANDAFLNMVGYSREDLQAGRVNWRAITPPEQLHKSEYSLDTMRQQQSSDTLEKEYIRKDGTRVPILLGGVMFKHSQSRGVSFVVDISTRKQAELQLQQQASELRQLNLALEKTTFQLTERNQELDRFVYTVSHDLKAPLRAIANLSQWIEDDLEGQLTPENQRQMELLRQRVSRLDAMIDGLLAYSRIGRTEVATERINVDELLFEILDSLAPPPTFTICVQPEMPILFAKRLLLSQVFSNLISNAIKHHDRADGRIEIRATQKGEYYEFSVADNGRGIAPENHERVFDIFQTLKGHEVKESTGIGLSIVKKIIETEGGQIFLKSQLGEGATFCFTWLIQPLGFDK
jgi:PAS domain S-box-containing protein